MKRFYSIASIVLASAALGYVYLNRETLGLDWAHSAVQGRESGESGKATTISTAPARIVWQRLDRSDDGFAVEMPENPQAIKIPAYGRGGETEPVDLIVSNPGGETSFAIAWADNPPAVRLGNQAPAAVLDAARNGLLSRTQTTLVTQSRCNPQGFPGRDLTARNLGGGILDARLVLVGQRLYMLTAAFPSMEARREQDVIRFFNSLSVTAAANPSPKPAPGSRTPAASAQEGKARR